MKATVGTSLYSLLLARRAARILEIGFYHGVSTCYFAAVAESLDGHVTAVDIPFSAGLTPNAETLLARNELEHRVTLRRAPEGAAWFLAQTIQNGDRFDAVFLDDLHTWAQTGFHALLSLRVLTPGGLLIMDDLDWTVSKSKSPHVRGVGLTDIQRDAPQVRMVWEILVRREARVARTWEEFGMGFAELH